MTSMFTPSPRGDARDQESRDSQMDGVTLSQSISLGSIATYVIDQGDKVLRGHGSGHQEHLLGMTYRGKQVNIIGDFFDGASSSCGRMMSGYLITLAGVEIRRIAELANVTGREAVGVAVYHELGHVEAWLDSSNSYLGETISIERLAWDLARNVIEKKLPNSWKGVSRAAFDKMEIHCLRSYDSGAGTFRPGVTAASLSDLSISWSPGPDSDIWIPNKKRATGNTDIGNTATEKE